MYKKLLIYLIAAVLGVLLGVVTTTCFAFMTVKGSGMVPAIYDGDIVLINKISRSYAKGDVVAFMSDVYGEEGESNILIRRIVACPEDTVEIKNNVFFLNGEPYNKYMDEPVHMDDLRKIKMGDNEFFVLGDNRKTSMDSRNEAIGALDIEDCLGKVCFK